MKENLEKDILQYGQLVGISYQLYQTVMSFFPEINTSLALFNMLISLAIVFLYLLVQKKGAHPVLLLTLHILALTGLTFFWRNYGGMMGTVPSFFCLYTAFIVVCSHGVTRWVIVVMLGGVLGIYFLFPGWLGMETFYEPDKLSPVQRTVDYVVVGGLIVAFTLYMKRKFVFYRQSISTKNRQLDQIAKTLHDQNYELATRQEETRAINDNLEAIVEERALEVENKTGHWPSMHSLMHTCCAGHCAGLSG